MRIRSARRLATAAAMAAWVGVAAAVPGASAAPAVSGSAASAASLLAAPSPCSKGHVQYVTNYHSPAVDALGLPAVSDVHSGKGVDVAVVDSGVDGRNAHFRGALLPGFSTENRSPATDSDGHGTAIAGLVAARPVVDPKTGVTSLVVGAAPAAKIIPVQVYVARDARDQGGQPDTTQLAQGIEAVANLGVPVIVVALSTGPNDKHLGQLRAAVTRAQKRGSLVVASAGDYESSSGSRVQLRYPAAFPGVLGVAGTDSSGKTGDWGYAGPQVDVSAPGAKVPSAYLSGGDCVFGIGDNGGDQPESSWATGIVGGLAAQLRATYPDESAQMIAYRIEMTAARPVASERSTSQGWGMVQPADAINLIPSPTDLGPAYPQAAAAKPPGPSGDAAPQVVSGDGLKDDRLLALCLVLGTTAAAGTLLIVRPLVLRRLRRRGSDTAGDTA